MILAAVHRNRTCRIPPRKPAAMALGCTAEGRDPSGSRPCVMRARPVLSASVLQSWVRVPKRGPRTPWRATLRERGEGASAASSGYVRGRHAILERWTTARTYPRAGNTRRTASKEFIATVPRLSRTPPPTAGQLLPSSCARRTPLPPLRAWSSDRPLRM